MSCSSWLTATLSYPFSLLPVLLNRQIISDNRFVKSWESSFLSNESEINHWKTSLVRTRRVTNNEWLYFPQGSGFSSFYLKEELHALPLLPLPHDPRTVSCWQKVPGAGWNGVHSVCGSLLPAPSHSLHSRLKLETSCLTYLLIPWVHPYLIYPLYHRPQPCVCLQLPVCDSPHKHNCLNRGGFFVCLHKMFSKDTHMILILNLFLTQRILIRPSGENSLNFLLHHL